MLVWSNASAQESVYSRACLAETSQSADPTAATFIPWVSWYGGAAGVDLKRVATTFRLINIDVDPDQDNFTAADIQTLRNGGRNRVLSYLNIGACENFRSYWLRDPPGHQSCVHSGALTTSYGGYPNEKWANLSNPAYQDLIVNYAAPRLVGRGIDGLFMDNLEVIEHGTGRSLEGPCDAKCAQSGLDLVWRIRRKFPDILLVMQNATGDVTRMGMTHGQPYRSLLDGVSHEEPYTDDPTGLSQMKAWQSLTGRPLWLAIEDYVGSCDGAHKPAAIKIYQQALADGFSAYVTDASGSQNTPCFWADFPP